MTLAAFRLLQVNATVTASGVVEVTPHDSNPIVADGVALAFRVNVAGAVTFRCPDGSEATITALEGETVNVPVTHILDTGTDADLGIVAFV